MLIYSKNSVMQNTKCSHIKVHSFILKQKYFKENIKMLYQKNLYEKMKFKDGAREPP